MNVQNPPDSPADRKRRLGALRMKLRSPKPGDVLLGMNEVEQLLRKDPEDLEVYGVLLDAVEEITELRAQVRNLLLEMMREGSNAAQKAFSILPSSVKDLLADADDAYYAAEYDKAVQLYRQVLKVDPENARAKDYLAKAKSEQSNTGGERTGLPRTAMQYYRRARSYLAARDFQAAMNSLRAAVEAAQAKGKSYPDAEQLLDSVQDALVADEFKEKAKVAIEKEQLTHALDLYNKALALEPTDKVIKKELDSLRGLLRAELELRKRGVFRIFAPLGQLQKEFDAAKGSINPHDPLLNFVEKQLNQIRFIRFGGIIVFIVIVFFLLMSGRFEFFELHPPIGTVTSTKTVVTMTLSSSEMPNTYGYTTEYAKTYSAPNSKWIGFIEKGQTVLILERRVINGNIWYFCQWEIENVVNQGWVLNVIEIRPTPIP